MRNIILRIGVRTSVLFALIISVQLLLTVVTCRAAEARSYAIVIGISDYKDTYWPRLPNGRPDAEQIATVLKRQAFDVRIFLDQNATVAKIDAYVEDELAPHLRSDDRVLFFYSGHGQTRTVGSVQFGYVVPYEATNAASTWISMDKIKEYSQVLNSARHQLFILDSCFSGNLITRAPVLPPDTPYYIDQLNLRTARTVITAGGKNQRVADSGYQHMSLFTYELVRALQDGLADVRRNGFITVNDIFSFVLNAASTSDQTPSRGTLPGDEGGEMVFTSPISAYVAKQDAPVPSIRKPIEIAASASLSRSSSPGRSVPSAPISRSSSPEPISAASTEVSAARNYPERYAAARARCLEKAPPGETLLCDELTIDDIIRSEATAVAAQPSNDAFSTGIGPERYAAARARCLDKAPLREAPLCDSLTPADVLRSEEVAAQMGSR